MRVSVIIPAYNYAHFLSECIESALNQTVLPHEILIVDDGSTDNTPEVVRPYLSSRLIKYIRKKNAGLSAARNTGIRASEGSILGLLDADDKWRHDKLELQLPLFANPGVGVVYSSRQLFNAGGLLPDVNNRRHKLQRGNIIEALMTGNMIPASSALVRRECFDKSGMFNENRTSAEDYDMWTRLAADGIEFDYVDQPLLMYRTGHASMISNTDRAFQEYRCVLRELFDGPGRSVCTPEMKRTAWAFFFAEHSYKCSESGDRRQAFIDALRSIRNRPIGVLDGLAWRVMAKCLLPKGIVDVLKRGIKPHSFSTSQLML